MTTAALTSDFATDVYAWMPWICCFGFFLIALAAVWRKGGG